MYKSYDRNQVQGHVVWFIEMNEKKYLVEVLCVSCQMLKVISIITHIIYSVSMFNPGLGCTVEYRDGDGRSFQSFSYQNKRSKG